MKQSELLCNALQRKCWDDTEAESRPHKVCSSFYFGTLQSVTYSLFNFPLLPLCKIPMRNSSCVLCTQWAGFPLQQVTGWLPGNSHSRRSELCGLTLGAKLTCVALHLLSWETNCILGHKCMGDMRIKCLNWPKALQHLWKHRGSNDLYGLQVRS